MWGAFKEDETEYSGINGLKGNSGAGKVKLGWEKGEQGRGMNTGRDN